MASHWSKPLAEGEVIKLAIVSVNTSNRPFIYPSTKFDDGDVKRRTICYNKGKCNLQLSKIKGKKELVNKYLAQPNVQEITATEADAWGKTHQTERLRFFDEDKVIEILNKYKNQIQQLLMKQEEKDILNPDNPTFGFNRRREFNINDYIK